MTNTAASATCAPLCGCPYHTFYTPERIERLMCVVRKERLMARTATTPAERAHHTARAGEYAREVRAIRAELGVR